MIVTVSLLLLSSWLIHVPQTMRLGNSRIPEEHFVCYQMSQRKWMIIKEYYRCLRRYMLSWRISRLGFVTPIVGEVSLGPLGNNHHYKPWTIVTNELVAGWSITERVKRLAGNEIELGMMIPPSNLGQITYRWQREQRMCYAVWSIKIFVEYVGANMSIQVPLLVIDRRWVSVMST